MDCKLACPGVFSPTCFLKHRCWSSLGTMLAVVVLLALALVVLGVLAKKGLLLPLVKRLFDLCCCCGGKKADGKGAGDKEGKSGKAAGSDTGRASGGSGSKGGATLPSISTAKQGNAGEEGIPVNPMAKGGAAAPKGGHGAQSPPRRAQLYAYDGDTWDAAALDGGMHGASGNGGGTGPAPDGFDQPNQRSARFAAAHGPGGHPAGSGSSGGGEHSYGGGSGNGYPGTASPGGGQPSPRGSSVPPGGSRLSNKPYYPQPPDEADACYVYDGHTPGPPPAGSADGWAPLAGQVSGRQAAADWPPAPRQPSVTYQHSAAEARGAGPPPAPAEWSRYSGTLRPPLPPQTRLQLPLAPLPLQQHQHQHHHQQHHQQQAWQRQPAPVPGGPRDYGAGWSTTPPDDSSRGGSSFGVADDEWRHDNPSYDRAWLS